MAAERIFNTILGLAFVFYLYQAVQLPDVDDTGDVLGASGFPLVIGLLALLVLLLITIRAVREGTGERLPLFDLRLPEGRLLLANGGLFAGYIVDKTERNGERGTDL